VAGAQALKMRANAATSDNHLLVVIVPPLSFRSWSSPPVGVSVPRAVAWDRSGW